MTVSAVWCLFLIKNYNLLLLLTSLESINYTASFKYLCKVVQRLDNVSLDGDFEKDELLSEFFLRLAAELQHLPATHNEWTHFYQTEEHA